MIPTNPIPEVPNYGSSAQYKDLPSPEQIRAGVIPLDSLPAAWWNALWACTNTAVNDARSAVGTLINEVCNAITGAGICINESCIDQLYQAIDTIRQRIGNAVTAGAVKSSSCCGEVSIDANGIMTANGVGNAAQLTTTAHTVVGAINELKTTYDCCLSDLSGCISGVDNSKAPTSHASANTTYGVGNADCYGHLKISDEYTCCVGSAADGVAASQMALYCVYCAISAAASLGNTKGCALGTAAAGTATTAARSDHVHPLPACVACADCGSCSGTYKAFGTNAFNSTAFTTCKGTVTIANCDTAKPIALCTGATSVGTSACSATVFRLMYNPTCRCMYAATAGGETCWVRYEGFSEGTKRAESVGPNLCTINLTCNGRSNCCFCYTVCTRIPALVFQRAETNAASISYAGADRVLFGTGGLICTQYFYANWGNTTWNENAAFNCFAKCYQVVPLRCTIPNYN